MATKEFSITGRALLYASAFVVIIAGLRAASSVVVPVLLSAFLAIIFSPLLHFLNRRLPFSISLGIVLATLIGLFLMIPLLVGGSLKQFMNALPALEEQFDNFQHDLIDQIKKWNPDFGVESILGSIHSGFAESQVNTLVNETVQFFGDGLIVLLMTAFMLTEIGWFKEKVALLDDDRGKTTREVANVIANVRRYIAIKTIISLATGIGIGLGLWSIGMDYFVIWAVLAFLLNYIPTIGALIAGIPPVMLSLINYDLQTAFVVAVIYFVINQVLGSVIEPKLQGQGLGLSPLVVFISLIFWGWVLGPVGMLLSAPITMTIKIACSQDPDSQWVAVLLGGKPRKKKAPASAGA